MKKERRKRLRAVKLLDFESLLKNLYKIEQSRFLWEKWRYTGSRNSHNPNFDYILAICNY